MNVLREIFDPAFLLRDALHTSILIGLACPVVGVFLVLRRMVFLGVALPQISSTGVALALSWPSALAFAIVWLAMARLFRYSSLSALVASVISPIIAAYSGDLRISSVLGLLTVTLWWTHRANIARLLAGTEGRIGAK